MPTGFGYPRPEGMDENTPQRTGLRRSNAAALSRITLAHAGTILRIFDALSPELCLIKTYGG